VIVMVTGAAGFIGSTLSRRILDDGHDVVGVDCLTESYDPQLKTRNLEGLVDHPRFQLVAADLSRTVPRAMLHEVEVVYHLAGQASVTRSWGPHFADYTRHNIAATQDLLAACVASNIRRVVYASSSSVYGDALVQPTDEAALPRPISPYGVSKLAAEHLCLAYHREMGLPVTCLRYFTVYGPRQRPDMGFHKLFRAAFEGGTFGIRGDGSASRDFTYVDDAVEATYRAGLADWDGVLNIGGGSPVTLADAVDIVQEIVGPIRLEHTPTVAGDARSTAADISRATAVLGFHPSTPLRTGLENMAAWAADVYGRELTAT
jgi:nucleoside-diphosphate-sugar epimerase